MTLSFARSSSRIALATRSLAGIATLCIASNSAADVACGETTCPKSFVCQSYEMDACPAIATRDGGAVDCQPTTKYVCEPGPCTVDADCADGMVCHSSTSTTCSGSAPGCDPNTTDCKQLPPATESCTFSMTSQCVPRYLLPCTVASDCGDGFTCEADQSCGCSGSTGSSSGGIATPATNASAPAGSGAASSIAADPATGAGGTTGRTTGTTPSSTQCTCTNTGTNSCRLQVIGCTQDTDCPSGFTCVDNSTNCAVSSGATVQPETTTAPSAAGGAATLVALTGGTTGTAAPIDASPSCPAPDPAKVCQPPYANLVGVKGGALDSSTQAPTANASGSNGTSGDIATTGAESSDDAHAASDPSTVSGGGCSIALSSDNSSLLSVLLAAVGIALGLRGRQRRSA